MQGIWIPELFVVHILSESEFFWLIDQLYFSVIVFTDSDAVFCNCDLCMRSYDVMMQAIFFIINVAARKSVI